MEGNVTPELLKLCRRLGKMNGLEAHIVARWSAERGYTLELSERVTGAMPSADELRYSFPIAGRQASYSGTSGHTDLFAFPMNVRPIIGIANVARAGDMLRWNFVLGNCSETMTAAGVSEDACTLEVFRGSGRLVAELAFDVRVCPIGNPYGMRGYSPVASVAR